MLKTETIIRNAHTAGLLHRECVKALDGSIKAKEYGRVEIFAHLCNLTNEPCIDREEDVVTIMKSYVYRMFAMEALGHKVA